MPSSSRSSPARVVVDRASRVHPGPVVAVADVSLTVEPGEFLALTGPSGSGKTSLLLLIGALDQPTTGTVEVDGLNLAESSQLARYHRELVGFVFQHHHLVAHLSPLANIELPLIGAGLTRRERRSRADELLDEVGMRHRRDVLIGHLSGGERQRVALARALANNPRLLLADEPTGALDTANTQRVLSLLSVIRERRGMTVVVVTYDPAVAQHADRVLHMRDGRLVPEDESLRPAEQLSS